MNVLITGSQFVISVIIGSGSVISGSQFVISVILYFNTFSYLFKISLVIFLSFFCFVSGLKLVY